jgi:hypothetical protein
LRAWIASFARRTPRDPHRAPPRRQRIHRRSRRHRRPGHASRTGGGHPHPAATSGPLRIPKPAGRSARSVPKTDARTPSEPVPQQFQWARSPSPAARRCAAEDAARACGGPGTGPRPAHRPRAPADRHAPRSLGWAEFAGAREAPRPRARVDPRRALREGSRAWLDPLRALREGSRAWLDPRRALREGSRARVDPRRGRSQGARRSTLGFGADEGSRACASTRLLPPAGERIDHDPALVLCRLAQRWRHLGRDACWDGLGIGRDLRSRESLAIG